MCRLSLTRIFFLLTSISRISCQSKHFCQALKDNKRTIDYSLTVPNGTFHRKFVIIKDHFWELEYNSTTNRRKREELDTTEKPFTKGPVYLKDVWSKQSKWLAGDYQLAFGVRYGLPDKEWIKTILALVDIKSQKFEWTLFNRNFGDLTDVSNKESSLTNFSDFKPQVAYNSYTRQEQNSVIFIEQTRIDGKKLRYTSRIQAYNISDAKMQMGNESSDPLFRAPARRIVPEAIKAISKVFKIKGLFGVKKSDSGGNSTVVLIEYCSTQFKTRSTDTDKCDVSINYHYCVAEESDKNAVEDGPCHPAKVEMQKLIDCSNPNDWIASSTASVSAMESSQSSSAEDTEVTENNKEVNSGSDRVDEMGLNATPSEAQKNGSLLWIIILVVVIIIIIILVILIVLCCRSKGKEGDEKEKKGPSDIAPSDSPSKSVRSKDVTSGPQSSGSNQKKLSQTSAKPKSTIGATNSMAVKSVRSSLK